MERKGLTKQEIVSTMTLSPHGDLSQYLAVCAPAAKDQPEFAAHFTSYLAENSQIRDINAAMPIICLAEPGFKDPELVENALAHLAKLSPRELVAAYQFGKKGLIRNKDVVEEKLQALKKDGTPIPGKFRVVKKAVGGWKSAVGAMTNGRKPIMVRMGMLQQAGRVNTLDRLVARYLHSREANHSWFERNVIQFRRDLERLYFLSHTKPSEYAKAVLYGKVRPCGSSLEAIAGLPNMNPQEAAAAIIEYRIPFLTINSVLGEKAKDKSIPMAMIDRMSPSELQTNAKMLEKFGVKDHPETRAALELSMAKLADKGSKKTTLKTAKAAAAVSDPSMKAKFQAVQEKQLTSMKGVDGDWLVAGDGSGSMQHAIEAARLVAGTLAKMVRGRVHLIFFNNGPLYLEVTGKTLEEIKAITNRVTAGGGTNIGCTLQYLMDRRLTVDGIAVVSDGGENGQPFFHDRYKRYVASVGAEPTVYFYKLKGSDGDSFSGSMASAGIDMTTYDLRGGVDEYSVVQLVQTMRVSRYGIYDEIMESKLITVESVLNDKQGAMAC